MIPEKRRSLIINKLDDKGICSINEFVEIFGVSRITILRDIDVLVKRGLVQRVHGGLKHLKNERQFELQVEKSRRSETVSWL